jgi:hypothetical protein
VTEYDHTYMEVLYAKNDLLGSLGKRKRAPFVVVAPPLQAANVVAIVAAEMSTALPGSAEMSTVLPGSIEMSTAMPGSAEISTALPGSAAQSAPPAQSATTTDVSAEMSTQHSTSAASKSAIEALGEEMQGSTFVPVQLKSRLESDLGVDQAGPSKAKTSKRMAMPKISFLDAKEIAEERELERIFTAKEQQ